MQKHSLTRLRMLLECSAALNGFQRYLVRCVRQLKETNAYTKGRKVRCRGIVICETLKEESEL